MTARTPDDKRKRALQLRSEPDVRLVDAAERLGLHPSTISRLEHAAGQPRRGKHRRGSFYAQPEDHRWLQRSPLQKLAGTSRGVGGPREQNPKRRGPGRPFPKGKSGNPGGRSPGFARAVREVCHNDPTELARLAYRIATGDASIDIVKVMKLRKAGLNAGDRIVDHPVSEVPNFDQMLEALKFMRDTGWGVPKQQLEVELTETQKRTQKYEAMTREELTLALKAALEAANKEK
jgi:hypothetical protein